MTWKYNPPGGIAYILKEGWFQDPLRPGDYLFVADGTTSYAAGTDGFTTASNLPELFDSTGLTYDSTDRSSGFGDLLSFFLEPNFTLLRGLPDHLYTGKKALTQTLSSNVEGIYWEGSRFDDELILSVSDIDTALQSFFYVGGDGDDTVYLKGSFENLVEGYALSMFWGANGNDSLVLEGLSSNWDIQKLKNEVGFEISKPTVASTFVAKEVETVVTGDKVFS